MTLLTIIERELVWKYYLARHVVKSFTRMSRFGKFESTSVDMSGHWDETLFNASDVNAYQEASKIAAFTTTQSKGSFVHDIDGNTLLDLCGTENLALGHNHDAFLKFATKFALDDSIINSSLNADHLATKNFTAAVKAALGPVAPSLLQAITLTGGRNATEHAVMHAMQARGSGSSSKVLGFKGANHGHGLAMTQFAHPQMSQNGLGWPCLSYPSSASEESRILESARAAVKADAVSAILVEPTNWQSGSVASDDFITQLGSIARESDAALIVDETNTGCGASGKGFF
jgi:acetylornithine/succinyldiaminopimelate/putrescine aminotransferase